MLLKNKILELEQFINKMNNLYISFDYVKLVLASPLKIKSWAEKYLPNGDLVGEVLEPETISTETLKPEINGLFCEKIFGPLQNYRCKCGKYRGFLFNKICEECNVEISDTKVRRYRMGYIDLYCPIVHPWYLNTSPNYLKIFLSIYNKNLKTSDIQKLIYFTTTKDVYINILEKLFNQQKNKTVNELTNFFTVKIQNLIGAELIKTILETINLQDEIQILRTNISLFSLNSNLITNNLNHFIDFKQLRVLESFNATKTNPAWMILTILPVLPPNLRPIYELENGKLILNDINELYRIIIEQNRHLKNSPINTLNIHHRILLQESIDTLIDKKPTFNTKANINNRKIKSLTEILKGKQGRFRQTLLGKRVDYSARSIISVGPELRLNQCGLPYNILKELFKPYLIKELLKLNLKKKTLKLVTYLIKKNKPIIWVLLNKLIKKYSILLNRAPTLHRFGIQAFDPILLLGNIIALHPLVCGGFNADFDGDQMAVHLPLYEISQLEIKTLMRPSYNMLSSATGELILKPTQDMVIGCYYLTVMITKYKNILKQWYSNERDALISFYKKEITLHTPILVRYKLSNQLINIINNTIFLTVKLNNIFFQKKQIKIYKQFKVNLDENKYYLLTNIGILIVSQVYMTEYLLTDLFFETSPGRLIFSINVQNTLKT